MKNGKIISIIIIFMIIVNIIAPYIYAVSENVDNTENELKNSVNESLGNVNNTINDNVITDNSNNQTNETEDMEETGENKVNSNETSETEKNTIKDEENEILSVQSAQKTVMNIPDGTYVIKTKLDQSKVVDIDNGSTNNGANVQIYLNTGVKQQMFKIKNESDGTYKIEALHSGKVVDVNGGQNYNGVNVQQYESNDTVSQRWIIEENEDGSCSIRSKCNNLYMDVQGGVSTNGTNIQMYEKNDTDSQKYVLEKVQDTTEGTKTIEDGMYKIRTTIDTNKIIDIDNGSKNNGANVQIYQDTDVKQQKFNIEYQNDGTYKIEAVHSNKSLDVQGGQNYNGVNVQQYESNDTISQRWIIKKNAEGDYSIISKCNGLYIDVEDSKTVNGTNIQMYQSTQGASQKFTFEKTEVQTIENGVYKIKSALNSKLVLDIESGSKSDRANLQLYTDNNSNAQKYQITYLENGYYSLVAVHSDKYLDVEDSKTINGTNVQQYVGTGGDSQKWYIKDLQNGYYNIISKCGGLYLDVSGGSAYNGTNIQIYEKNQTKSQQFIIEETTITKENTSNFLGLDESKYPGYKQLLQKLQNEHPNWSLQIYYTGLNWDEVLNNEDTIVKGIPRSLTQYTNEWRSEDTDYGSGWYKASRAAIAYMMDPRQSLDEGYVFQFQDLTSTSGSYQDIYNMISGTFLTKYSLYSTESIINTILSSSSSYGISPFHIVSRILQEQGTEGTTLNGYQHNGRTVYNLFNIGATGTTSTEIIKNGALYAYDNHWFTPETCINGSVSFLKSGYFNVGQTTLYFQKYDVVSQGGLYSNQYMQNIRAANDEGKRISDEYKQRGLLDSHLTFVIPVYEGMPETAASRPNQ